MARIFIALRFGDEVKKALVALQNALRAQGVEGNYCAWGNLHMTLAFIGERYDLPTIRQAVNEVRFEPFTMTLGPLGTFPTKAGVVWCGVSDGEAVTALANQLREPSRPMAWPIARRPSCPISPWCCAPHTS